MFITFISVNLAIGIVISAMVLFLFKEYIARILKRIIGESLYFSWYRFILFGVFVAGTASANTGYRMEQYIQKHHSEDIIQPITANAVILEIYQTILSVTCSVSYALLTFFTISLISYTIIRCFEIKNENRID